MKLEVGSKSIPFRRDGQKADALLALPEHGLFVVVDGGQEPMAAEAALDLLLDYFQASDESEDLHRLIKRIEEAYKETNKRIEQMKDAEAFDNPPQISATTVILRPGAYLIGHLGNTRAFLYRNQVLRQITRDHSKVYELHRQRLLRKEDMERHPARDELTRHLAGEPPQEPDLAAGELFDGDVILLASDGLVIGDEEIIALIEKLPAIDTCADRLAIKAKATGTKDDVSVLLVRAEHVERPANLSIPKVGPRDAPSSPGRQQPSGKPESDIKSDPSPSDATPPQSPPAASTPPPTPVPTPPPPDQATPTSQTSQRSEIPPLAEGHRDVPDEAQQGVQEALMALDAAMSKTEEQAPAPPPEPPAAPPPAAPGPPGDSFSPDSDDEINRQKQLLYEKFMAYAMKSGLTVEDDGTAGPPAPATAAPTPAAVPPVEDEEPPSPESAPEPSSELTSPRERLASAEPLPEKKSAEPTREPEEETASGDIWGSVSLESEDDGEEDEDEDFLDSPLFVLLVCIALSMLSWMAWDFMKPGS